MILNDIWDWFMNKDGLTIEYHANGNKKSEGNYVNGLKEGKWTEWHENGLKASEGNFKLANVEFDLLLLKEKIPPLSIEKEKIEERIKSIKTDTWRYWHNNGQIKSEIFYQLVNRPGLGNDFNWALGSELDKKIKEIRVRSKGWCEWYSNGNKAMEAKQSKEGSWAVNKWHKNGNLGVTGNVVINYPNFDSSWRPGWKSFTIYDNNEKKEYSQEIDSEGYIGIKWHPNGQKQHEVRLTEPQQLRILHNKGPSLPPPWPEDYHKYIGFSTFDRLSLPEHSGAHTLWYKSGQKKSEYQFSATSRSGLWVKWHENGQKEFEVDILHFIEVMPNPFRRNISNDERAELFNKHLSKLTCWDEKGNLIDAPQDFVEYVKERYGYTVFYDGPDPNDMVGILGSSGLTDDERLLGYEFWRDMGYDVDENHF